MASGEIRAGTTPGGRAARVIHHGPYDGLRNTYAELGSYLASQGLVMPPRSWEVYLNEPGKVPDADLATEIFVPLPA
jgi:effector-binding domain-containing protein